MNVQHILIYKNGCLSVDRFFCLLPIGAQTAEPNGLKYGIGVGMDRGTACGLV